MLKGRLDRKEVTGMLIREGATIVLPELEEPFCCRNADQPINWWENQTSEYSNEQDEN